MCGALWKNINSSCRRWKSLTLIALHLEAVKHLRDVCRHGFISRFSDSFDISLLFKCALPSTASVSSCVYVRYLLAIYITVFSNLRFLSFFFSFFLSFILIVGTNVNSVRFKRILTLVTFGKVSTFDWDTFRILPMFLN